MGQIQPRIPWHQHMDIQEAADVFRQVQRWITAGITAQQFGAELDIEKLKADGALLTPSQGQTLEGLKVFFPTLYRQDMDGLEEGELNLSPAPSQGDLDLSGDWPKKVSWKLKEDKKEDKERKSDADDEDEDNQNTSQYFDAEQETDTPPLASSPKKKTQKKRKK